MADKNTETQTEETSQGALQDFSFDNEGGDSWFGIVSSEEGAAQKNLLKEVKATAKAEDNLETETLEVKEKTGVKEVKVDEDEDENEEWFGEKPKQKTENPAKESSKQTPEENEEEELEESDPKFYAALAADLKAAGVLQNVEIPEGDLDREKLIELQDKEVEARVDETFESFFGEMDDDAKAFLKHKKNGGSTQDFFTVYRPEVPFSIENFDVKDENQRKTILKHYLQTVDQLDEGDIEDKLKWYKESGKEEQYATKYLKIIEAEQAQAKEDLKAAQEAAIAAKEAGAKKFKENLATTLTESEEILGFPISKEDQKTLIDKINKPTVKVGKNKYIPSFQHKIAAIFKADTKEAQQKLLLLGKLVENDFDFSEIKTKEKTKITKKVESNLEKAKAGVKTATAGGYGRKSITDYFND